MSSLSRPKLPLSVALPLFVAVAMFLIALLGAALFVLVPQFGLVGAASSLVLAQTATALVLGQRLAEVLEVRLLRLMMPSREDLVLLRDALAKALDRA